ncbi:MAG: translocation/assembly module TamB domain-containing protein [Gemmatimonadetes bacterium]|nr:translocation/assembly module TamB domain-containing protein [Gemmatimonadota bacterium]
MRRVRLFLTAGFVWPLLVLFGGLLGTAAAVLWSPPGQRLLARVVTTMISGRVAGRVEIGGIRGSLLGHAVLERVAVRDSLGGLVLTAERLEVRYTLPELLAGRLVFHEVRVERPVIHLIRLRRSRWNYEEVFRSKPGTPGGSSALVELHDLVIRGGTIRVDVATTPHAPKVPTSRNGAAPAQPRIEASPDGPVRVYGLSELDARIPLVRISTPARDPILVRIAELRGTLADPALTITALQAEIITAGDSLRFTLDRAAMPGTIVQGGGAVRWPQDTVLFDWALSADTVDLDDLRWISPDFPSWQGRGEVVARSNSNTQTEYRLEKLTLGHGVTRAVGRMVAIVDTKRGLGFRDLDLMLTQTPLAVMRPYLDTLPFAGMLEGRLRLDGFLDAMRVAGDLRLADALVPGQPISTFRTDGVIHFGGDEGAVFDGFQLLDASVALGTVRRVVPAMLLPGQLHLVGRLNGPWQNARFDGLAEHMAPNQAMSRLLGAVRLDTRREVLGVEMDATFDRLSFDALRSGYPSLTPHGGLTGLIVTRGSLESLWLDADVTGDLGTIRALGTITAMDPRWAADSLDLTFSRVDLDALLGKGGSTALNGRMRLHGAIDSLVPPDGSVVMDLDRSRVGGLTFDQATLRLGAAAGMLQVDSAEVRWPEGQISGRGAIGWAVPDSGSLHLEAWAASLQPFDSLLRAATGIVRDTLAPRTLDGLARLAIDLHGSLDRAAVVARLDAEDVVLDQWRVGVVGADVTADSLGAKGLTLALTADSLGNATLLGRAVAVQLRGRADSLAFTGEGELNGLQLATAGTWQGDSTKQRIALDSLALAFPRQQWRLERPTQFRLADGLATLDDTLALRTRDGSGAITLFGSFPGDVPGTMTASAVGLDLADLVGLMQGDTSAVAGLAALDLRLGGTREAPTIRGSAAVTGPVLGSVRAPMVRAAFDYESRMLRSHLTFWRTGDAMLDVDLALPFDLALAARSDRKLPGPIAISARADSVDLAVFEAFTPNIRNASGIVQLDLHGSGSWAAPRLGGSLSVRNGRMRLPSLGATYDQVDGWARFSGDSLLLDSLSMNGDGGTLRTTGSVRFDQLTMPVLDLTFDARGFLAMNVPNYLKLRAEQLNVTLRGPVAHPVLRGSGTLSGSVLYFADLVTKDIIDLEDPAYLDLVDTLALRRRRLGAAFQNRFLDSLRIEGLRFRLGTEVWLRSSEANVQLEGSVTIDKVRKQYRLAGTFTAPRGTYTLKIPYLPARDFTVESGTVSYFGSPDLNAELDLQARHIVHTSDGEDVPIVAHIEGSIQVPRLTLSSPGRNLPDRDLISFLMFGIPQGQLGGSQRAQVTSTAQSLLAGAFTGELSRLATDAGFDLFELRSGILEQRQQQGPSLTQLLAGFQLSRRFFATFNAGFCTGGGSNSPVFSRNNLGASLEYRLSREFRLKASAEPVGTCQANTASTLLPRRYQFGTDLLWEREY